MWKILLGSNHQNKTSEIRPNTYHGLNFGGKWNHSVDVLNWNDNCITSAITLTRTKTCRCRSSNTFHQFEFPSCGRYSHFLVDLVSSSQPIRLVHQCNQRCLLEHPLNASTVADIAMLWWWWCWPCADGRMEKLFKCTADKTTVTSRHHDSFEMCHIAIDMDRENKGWTLFQANDDTSLTVECMLASSCSCAPKTSRWFD